MAATPSSGIPFPCGHVHQISFSTKLNEEDSASAIGVIIFQADGCEQAATWGNGFLAPLCKHVEQLNDAVRKGEDRQGRLWKDLEMAFTLVREFGGLYQDAEKKRVEKERELAALRRSCDCSWRRPDQPRHRAAHLH